MRWPWAALGWVALVPWLAALDATRSLRATVGVALLMATAFELAVFGWFANALQAYTALPRVAGLGLLALAAPLLQPQLPAFALARWWARRRGLGAVRRAVAGACVWVGVEWLCPKLFGDTLGYGLWPSVWMRQGADLVGVSGLTLLLLLGNECALAALRGLVARDARAAVRPAAALAALLGALLGYGAVRDRQVATATAAAEPIRVGIVQANIVQYGRMALEQGTFGAVDTILAAHMRLSEKLLRRQPPDLLLWGETVYPTTFGTPRSAEGAAFDRAIAGFVLGTGVPLVFGAYDVEGTAEFNAAVVLEPPRGGSLEFETYRKAALFPLTERVPAWLDRPWVRRRLPWLGTWTPGRGGDMIVVTLPNGRPLRVAPLICYDVLAPAHVRTAVRAGAELIVTLSNDAWFGTGPAAWRHLVAAAFRSVETRRPQVRATNTGISAVIDAAGSITAATDVGRRAVLAARVTPEEWLVAPAVQWGGGFGPAALALGVALLAVPTRRRAPGAAR